MEYNNSTEIVKDLNFGNIAKERIIAGVDKLATAVKSTLGASGKCVIYEDARGKPVITKDGVTVAESVVLFDPVENIGATLIKEASKNTVKEAGDGTTTAIVLAQSLLKEINNEENNSSIREIKEGVNSGLEKINKYLKCKFSFVCSSGTAAIHLAMLSIGLKKNDIILMPAINFIAAYNIAKSMDLKVYLVDVNEHTGQITSETIIKCIKENKLKKIKSLIFKL